MISVFTGRPARTLFAIGLLALIAWLIEPADVLALLRNTDWRWLLVGALVVQLQVCASALRWQITAVQLGQSLGLSRAIGEYFLATVGNLSLPGGITGDAARVYRNRQAVSTSASARSVMIERFSGQLALALVTTIGWLLWPLLMQSSAPLAGARLLLLMATGAVVAVALTMLLARLGDNRVARFFREFGPALKTVWLNDHRWVLQGLLSVFIVATYLAVFALCALALQHPLPASAIITIVPLVLLSMVIPVSVGGWGVREAAAATLWPLAGLSSEAGVATSVLYGVVSLVSCLPGALWAWVAHTRD